MKHAPRQRTRPATTAAAAAAAAALVAAIAVAVASCLWISPPASGGSGSDLVGGSGSGSGLTEQETSDREEQPLSTIVVVDAGSSGCRLNVYHVVGERDSMTVSGTTGGKIEPGLSSFAESPKDAAMHMLPLLSRVTYLVPKERHPRTRVFIKSTAGMRLLPEETQNAIYDEIYNGLLGHPEFPFALRRGDLGTIDGDKEAFYAVLSANYIKGRIDARLHPTGHESGAVGALDMGGASTQIIFRHIKQSILSPVEESVEWDVREGDGVMGKGNDAASEECQNQAEAGEKRGWEPIGPVSEDDFWGASHLGYGVAEVRAKVWSYLVERHAESAGSSSASGSERNVVNPCSFVNRVDVWMDHRLIGSGDVALCEETVSDVLWGRDEAEGGNEDGDVEFGEGQRAQGIGGVSMPTVTGDFLAMSVFFYAMHCLEELGPAELVSWPEPTLAELRHAAEGFCAMEWDAVLESHSLAISSKHTTSEEALAHRCVEVVYMMTLLRDGYGFPEHSRNVIYALESDGMEVEWTLGYALAELARVTEPLTLEGPIIGGAEFHSTPRSCTWEVTYSGEEKPETRGALEGTSDSSETPEESSGRCNESCLDVLTGDCTAAREKPSENAEARSRRRCNGRAAREKEALALALIRDSRGENRERIDLGCWARVFLEQ